MSDRPLVLENKLACLFNFENTVLLGRARSGLVALIEVFQQNSDHPVPVLIPENICPALVTAISAAGGQAVTVPVSPLCGLPDDSSFVSAMKQAGNPGIVMPVHLYGFQGDYRKTVEFAQKNKWFILENDTNAIRMNSKDRSFGDALMVSFGYSKPIEIGSGGALLTNDRNLAELLRKRVAGYDMLTDEARKQEENSMLRRRAIRQNLDTGSEELRQICDVEKGLSRFRFDDRYTDALLTKLDQFPDEKERRLERKALWDEALIPLDNILQPVPLKQPVPWRVIRRVPYDRDHFTKALWKNGVDAGINYRSLWRELPPSYLSGEAAVHDDWGSMVLNLWVTDGYNKNNIAKSAGILMEAANAI